MKALCGRYPCPHLCSRVEHCPAGQERVQWLWLVRKGERGQLSRRPLEPAPGSQTRALKTLPGDRLVNTATGEMSKSRYSLKQLNEGVLYNVFGAREYPQRHRPIKYGRRSLKPYTSWAFLTALLVFIGFVVFLGLVTTGGDFAPGYEPPSTPAYYEQH